MARELTAEALRRWRLRSQRLAPSSREDDASVADVVSRLVGLQAQDETAAALGVRARSRDLTAKGVTLAREEDASIVRTWCMRGTLHLVAADDVPWLLAVFGPVYAERGRRRLADLGFDDAAAAEAVETVRDAIARDGPLTRAGVADALVAAGFDFDPDGQATYHLVRRAGLLGHVCQVAPVAGEVAYGFLDEWVSVDGVPDRESALERLARRYLAGYAPASIADFAAWSGLPLGDVRTGWDRAVASAETVPVDGDAPLLAVEDAGDLDDPAPLRLLPAYDAYLLGYDGRAHAVDEDHARRVHPGGGIIRPTVVDDGHVVATWSLDRSRSTPALSVDPFDSLSEDAVEDLESETADVGRFLDLDIELLLGG